MRIGVITDTHIHDWKGFSRDTETGISRRLLEQVANFRQAIQVFKDKKVDCIVHGGDIVHGVGKESNVVLNYVKQLLSEVTVPVYFTIGNHDTNVRINPTNHHIVTNLLRDEIPIPKNICLVNYTDEIDYEKIKNFDLVVLHKTPTGAEANNFTFLDEVNWRKLASQNKFVAFGHIHEMQKLSENCFVIGSPMHFNFGDKGSRGVWIVDTNPCYIPSAVIPVGNGKTVTTPELRCKPTLEFIKLDYPEFITVKSAEEAKQDGNYYRVLDCKTKINQDNVVSVVVPEVFEERIQSSNFREILKEWLQINNKDESYLASIEDILEEKMQIVRNIFKGRIVSVSGKDFLSIGEVQYNVENGFILVEGPNGSGKTALFELVVWTLFGDLTKDGSGDDVIRNRPTKQNDCEGSIRLSLGTDSVEIKRSFKKGLALYINGVQPDSFKGLTKTERQKYLIEFLGFDKRFFMAADYFSQVNLQVLTRLDDSDQTNMATDLLGFEQYTELYDKTDKKIKKLELDISKWEEEKIRFDKEIAVLGSEVSSLDVAIKDKERQVASFAEFVNSYTKKKNDLEFELSRKRVQSQTHTEQVTFDSEMEYLDDQLLDIEDRKKRLLEIKDDLFDTKYSEGSKLSTSTNKINQLSEEVLKLTQDIICLHSSNTGIRCDKCGSMITKDSVVSFIREKQEISDNKQLQITNLEKEHLDLSQEIEKVDLDLSKIKVKIEVLNEEQFNIKRDINKLQDQKEEHQRKVKEYEVTIGKIQSQVEEINKSIDSYSERINEFKEDKYKLEVQQLKTKNDLKLTEANADLVVQKVEHVTIEIGKLEFWKIAFSPKGIRSVLLDRFCNQINKIVNDCLSTISNGNMSAVFSPTKTLKGGEERNKIGLKVFVNGHESKYGLLSGGEQKRVDCSVCFGLNHWVSEKYGLEHGLLGILILDEIFGFLDTEGAELVAQLLWSEGKKQSVFVIDHALDLSSWAQKVWKVSKENELTRLEV